MVGFGGRKFLLAFIVVLVLLAVLVIASVSGKLETGLAGVLVGAVTWVITQFGMFNVSATKAALAAGGAKNEEATRLSGMSDADVLAAAPGATEAVRAATDGAVVGLRTGAGAARAAVSGAANESRERLRRAATDGGGGSGG